MQIPAAKYNSAPLRLGFTDQFEERLRALPGVTNVALTRELPTTVRNSNGVFIEGRPWAPDEPVPFVTTSRASVDYFGTFGIPLRQGRVFTRDDVVGSPPVVIALLSVFEWRNWEKFPSVG